jgi:hypothetical protein
MLGMAKKKTDKKTDRTASGKRPNAHKGTQVPFRVDDPRLVEALDAYAASIRRSRNMTIIILLEQGLEQVGHWPPQRPSEDPSGS